MKTRRVALDGRLTTRRRRRRSVGGRGLQSGVKTVPGSSVCVRPPTSRSTRQGAGQGVRCRFSRRWPRPRPESVADGELLSERAGSTATSLLALAGVDAAPRSREHTLLASVFAAAWQAGRDLDLGALIQQVQTPPFQKVGVVDLESFYPAKERFELAMTLNGLLAAPGFEQWLEGESLDPATLLYTADGRPRVAVFSIAHLGDAERMFFVSLLLNQVVAWMRRQSGTTSLRAIVYMDEIMGYFPPVANPPSKGPFLTLLKQGRAFGIGVVLATQNPVDLDYKGLSNTGTWFLGRLQTERDKLRVLDGLEGAASGSFDRAEVDRLLSVLGKRMFLLHNVHEPATLRLSDPLDLVVFEGSDVASGHRKDPVGPECSRARPPGWRGPGSRTSACSLSARSGCRGAASGAAGHRSVLRPALRRWPGRLPARRPWRWARAVLRCQAWCE